MTLWPGIRSVPRVIDGDPLSSAEEEVDPLLTGLGFPEPDCSQPGLTALHAGAAFHRLALMLDVVEMYARDASLPADEPAYVDLLRRSLRGDPPRVIARRLYRAALRVDERLAEAWFNLGRLLQDAKDQSGALIAYGRAASLPVHPRAQPHAQLHASAHWHAATILEDVGRDDEALARYREAIARCDNFGVQHVRYAHFLRRRGLVAEATGHYQKLMTYSHCYFTEFALPTLIATAAPNPGALSVPEVLYETSLGDAVVFWKDEYYRLPKSILRGNTNSREAIMSQLQDSRQQPGSIAFLLMILSRLAFWRKMVPVRRASSISDFEQPL